MELDQKVIDRLKSEFISAIKDEGLVLVPEQVGKFATKFSLKQKALLKQKSVTPYQIANYDLISGVTSLKTIKIWIREGKIKADEWYKTGEKYFVITEALKRLNDA